MYRELCLALATSLACAAALAEAPAKRMNPVPGEKLDSGLAEIPRATRPATPAPTAAREAGRARVNIVIGEKLDSGLGEAVARR